ncbi:MAG: response regulator [bacterium]|jgi:CheY-like chemotaxis protein|nr:response regulator [bacterium]
MCIFGILLIVRIIRIVGGKLPAYRTPGGHRRILRKELLAFLKKYNMPIHEDLEERKKIKILVVDDDENVTRLVERSLRKSEEHYQVSSVRDGIEAMLKIGREIPDLLILDIFMPGMNGLEVCKKLNENPVFSGIKIIAISGQNIEQTRERILTCGADVFLPKPFTPECLHEKVRDVLYSMRERG